MNGKQRQPKRGRIGDRYRKVNLNNDNILKENRKEITKIAFLILILLSVVLGTSYALFTVFIDNSKETEIVAGTFNVQFEDGNKIDLNNASPMSDDEGLATAGYTFTIKNTGTINANYNVSLEEKESSGNTLDKKYIKYSVKVGDGDWSTPRILGDNQKGLLINNGELSATAGENEVKYELKLWLREDADNSAQGKSFSARLVVSAVQNNADDLEKIGSATPVIKLNGNNVINLKQGEEYQELGVSAVLDDKDTITTNDVEYSYTYLENNEEINTNGIDTSNPGIYYVYYKVTDSDGNTGISVRVVNVSTNETEVPKIELKDSAIIRISKGTKYVEPGVTATINGKDASDKVITIGKVNTKVLGTYIIKYVIETSKGNVASVTRTVMVEEVGNITLVASSPKIVNNKAEVVISINSVDGYVNGYAITKSDKQPTEKEFKTVKQSASVEEKITLIENGTYYIWAKDNNGNLVSERVEVSEIDDKGPVCVFNDISYAALDDDTSIELVCTDTSGLKTAYLDAKDFEINDTTKASITSVSGIEEVENGFKYIIDVKGLNLGQFNLKFKSNIISDVYGNMNNEVTSNNIEVTDFKVDSNKVSLNVTENNEHQIVVTGNKGDLVYSSNNEDVAIVSDTGLITAIAPGSATITVKDTVTGVKKKITVDVEKSITAKIIKQGRGVTSITDSDKKEITEVSCKLTKNNKTSCEATLPNINVSDGYTALGFSNDATSHTAEYEAGQKVTLTIDGQKEFYSISKRDSVIKTAILNANGYGAIKDEIYEDIDCKTAEIYNDEELDNSCEITLPSISVYDGYTARGWSQNKTTKTEADKTTDLFAKDGYIKAGKKVKIDKTTYLYTITSKDEKVLTANYDANGATLGTVDDSNTKCTLEETWNEELPSLSCGVTAPTIIREGFDISGFSTDKDALKNKTAINSPIIPLTEETTGKTWYAQTKKDINVVWDSNGATITSTKDACSIINTDNSCSITSPGISRDNYNVVGFSKNQADDGTDAATIWKVNTSKAFTAGNDSNNTYYAITNKVLNANFTYYSKDNSAKSLKNQNEKAVVRRLANTNSSKKSESQACLLSNKNDECNVTVPNSVISSKGPLDIDYAGLARDVDSEEDLITTDVFSITKTSDYYAIYKTPITPKFYYYNNGKVEYDDSVTGTRLSILKEKDGDYIVVQEALPVPEGVSQSLGLDENSKYFGVTNIKNSKEAISSVSTANEEYYAIYKGTWEAKYTKDSNTIEKIGSTVSSCNNYQTTNGTTYNATGENCSINLPSITPKTAYKVLGWYDGDTKVGDPGDSYQITGNKTLTAKAEINEYTVNYDYDTNGGDSASKTSDSVQIGSNVDLSITANKDGWEFVGWNTDKDAHDKLDTVIMPSKNITLYAIYRKNPIDLIANFNANGATLSKTDQVKCTIPAAYNNSVQATSCSVTAPTITASNNTPTIIGYNTTADAHSNSELYNKETNKLTLTTSNTGSTWYAQTKKDAVTYTVDAYEKGSNVTAVGSKTTANSSCTIAATYNGLKQDPSCSVTAPSITAKEGYTSVGWSLTNGSTTGSSVLVLTKDNTGKTWYANATANSYTIKYYDNEKEVLSDDVKVGSNPTIKTAKELSISKTGYTFKGWATTNVGDVTYTAGQKPGDLVKEDKAVVKLYAVWADETGPTCALLADSTPITTANTKKIVLECSDTGSGITSQNLTTTDFETTANGSVIEVSAPKQVSSTAYHYEITVKGISVGTFTTSLKAGTIKDNAGNGNVKATSSNITVNGRTYTATFTKNGAGVSSISSTSISCTTTGSSLKCTPTTLAPTINVVTGYTAVGWNTNKDTHTSIVNSNESFELSNDITYYSISKKNAVTYTATFYKNGAGTQTNSSGTAVSDATVTRACTIAEVYNNDKQATSCNITTPTVTGSSNTPIVLTPAYAESANATVGSISQNVALSLNGNKSYYAITKKDAVTLTANFNANGATLSSTTQASCNLPAVYNGSKQETSCSVTAPTITAPNNTPTIIGYNTTSDAHSNNTAYNKETNKLTLTNSNTGSTWYAQTKKDAETYTVDAYKVGSNVTAVGSKTADNGSCTIAATYNGAKQATSCNVTAPTITAKEGYTSVGWSLTSGATTGSSVLALTKDNTGKTWYANATANSYTINYYDGTTLKGSSSAKVDTNPTLTKASSLALSKAGYTFKGWATANGGSVLYTDGQTISGNLATKAGAVVNLYAVWKDETAPTCSFSNASATTTGNTTSMTLTCTDNGSGVVSKTLATTDFETTANGSVTNVSAPTSVTNGYMYTVTVKGISVGTFTTSLKAGSIKDNAGNSNVKATSSNITVNGRTYTVTFTKGSNVSTISSTSSSCTTTGSSLTCTIGTYPTITTSTGYSASTWYDSTANKDTGIASGGSGSSYAISRDTTMTAQASVNYYYYDVNPDSGIASFDISGAVGTPLYAQADYYTQNPYGQEVTITNVKAKEGYTYTGYTLSGSLTELSGSSKTNIKTKLGADRGAIQLNSTINSYTVTYNANGGSSVSKSSATVNYGSKVDLTPTASRTGYTFKGWNTSSSATTALTTLTMGASNTTLYAVWKDEAAPTCSFSSAAAITTGNTTSMTLTCTDNGSGVVSKTLATTDFETTANGSVTNVSAPTAVTGGYKYTVTVKGLSVGTFTTSLKAGSIKDNAGNSNVKATSSNITVNGRTYTVTFSKGLTSAISSTSSSCTTTGSSLTCTIGTYPTITPRTGYTASTWYDSTANKDTGIASGGSGSGYAISRDTTMTAQDKDITPPTKPTITNSSRGEWTNGDVSISLSSTDSGSGISTYQYRYSDSNSWLTIGSTSTFSNEMNRTVYYRAIDNAGNISEEASTNIAIDKTNPTLTLTSEPTTTWTAGHVSFTVTASDSGSGIAGYYMSTSNTKPTVDASGWEPNGSTTRTYGTLNGTYYIWTKDKAGNISDKVTVTVTKSDSSAPELTLTSAPSTAWTTGDKSFTVTASDSGSGIAGYYISTSNTTPAADASGWEASTSTTKTYAKGTGTYYIWAKDAVGYVSDKVTVTVTNIDNTSPNTPTIAATKSSSNTSVSSGTWSTEGLNFKFTLENKNSSGSDVYYCYDTTNTCTPSIKATSGAKIESYNDKTGTYYIRYMSKSGAGLSSAIGSYQAKVDTTTPTVSIKATKYGSNATVSNGSWSDSALLFVLTQGTVGSSGATIKYCYDTTNTCTPTTQISSGTTFAVYPPANPQFPREYYVRYKIESGAGLSSTIGSYHAQIDLSAPSATIASKITIGSSISNPVSISDSGGSGLSFGDCTLSETGATNYITRWNPVKTKLTYSGDVSKTYTISCSVIDNAGNTTTKTASNLRFAYGSGWSEYYFRYGGNKLTLKDGPYVSNTGTSYKLYLVKNSSASVGWQYGPYVPLSDGCYKITYEGNNLNHSSLMFKPTFNTGGGSYRIDNQFISSTKRGYYIKVVNGDDKPYDAGVEFKVSTTYTNNSSYLSAAPYITSLRAEYAGDKSIALCNP